MSERYLVDTNVLLRILSGEPLNQAEAARQLFESAASGEVRLEVSSVVVAETFCTLVSFYGVDRKGAAEKLLGLIQQRGLKVHDGAQVFGALQRLQLLNVGFADAFLAAGAAAEGIPVASFDRDFDKFSDVKRVEPR